MSIPKVFIVIPVFNRIADTVRCLDSLRIQDYERFTIILCDDGSTDGTSELVKHKYPETIVLKGDGNLWWSGATNLGVSYALSRCSPNDLILALNNDLVVKADYLSSLVSLHRKFPKSLIGSLAVYKDNPDKIAYSGERWYRFLAKKRPNLAPFTSLKGITCEYFSSDTLPGRGTLIPSCVFKEISLFDAKRLPQYGADNDFSLRAKKAGYMLLVSCKAIVISDTRNEGYASSLNDETFRAFVKSHFSRKSYRNIATRFWMGAEHVPRFYLPIYFILSEIRVTGSFFRTLLAGFAGRFFRDSKR